MWFTASQLVDPKLVREQQIYYDELRATFDDPLPIHTETEFHPLMIHNEVLRNKAKQKTVLGALEHYETDAKARAKELAEEFTAGQAEKAVPKPGQPGFKPPGQQPTPGQPIHPPAPNVPGTPTYDPNKPETGTPEPSTPPQHYEDKP